MKIATAPVNWNSPDVPEYRPWTSYPQLLHEMQEAGYSATEWGTNMPKDPAVLGPDLAARGLQMLGGFVGIELRNPAKRQTEVQRGLEIGNYFKSLGGKYLIAADSGDKGRVQLAGRVGAEDGLSDLEWKSLCTGLNELGQLLKEDGVQLVFHNHVGTYIETEAETSRLLDGTDPSAVGWCLDCGHLT
jgi:inosose dehydratase